MHRVFLVLILALCSLGCDRNTRSLSKPAVAGGNSIASAKAASAPLSDVTTTLAELTQAVRKYAAEQQKVPISLDELVASNYLPAIPQAPAGKKFAIDKKLQVYLADR